jgi:hypothetical protein
MYLQHQYIEWNIASCTKMQKNVNTQYQYLDFADFLNVCSTNILVEYSQLHQKAKKCEHAHSTNIWILQNFFNSVCSTNTLVVDG